MSTRAQIIIKDESKELWFYRHSDGYPDGTMPALQKFLEWVEEKRIRDNVGQAAGWLILIGAEEYGEVWEEARPKTQQELFKPGPKGSMMGWKCGAFEPCTPIIHGDTEFLYTIDLKAKTITIVDGNKLEGMKRK